MLCVVFKYVLGGQGGGQAEGGGWEEDINQAAGVCVWCVCVRQRRLMCALLLCPLGGAAR